MPVAPGVGRYIVRLCNQNGIVLLIDRNGTIRYMPKRLMKPRLLRLLSAHRVAVTEWLIGDAVTQE